MNPGPKAGYGVTRHRILDHVRTHGPVPTWALEDAFDLSPSAVSLHLGKLRREGLVDYHRLPHNRHFTEWRATT
jgi:DNA-binding transcriptional ArsR family regulator